MENLFSQRSAAQKCAQSPFKSPISAGGTSYLELMCHSVSIGDISALRTMVRELKEARLLTREFSLLVAYCDRASAFEAKHGVDALLDVDHPSVKAWVASGVLTSGQHGRILRCKTAIASLGNVQKQFDALHREGRRIVELLSI